MNYYVPCKRPHRSRGGPSTKPETKEPKKKKRTKASKSHWVYCPGLAALINLEVTKKKLQTTRIDEKRFNFAGGGEKEKRALWAFNHLDQIFLKKFLKIGSKQASGHVWRYLIAEFVVEPVKWVRPVCHTPAKATALMYPPLNEKSMATKSTRANQSFRKSLSATPFEGNICFLFVKQQKLLLSFYKNLFLRLRIGRLMMITIQFNQMSTHNSVKESHRHQKTERELVGKGGVAL